MKLFNSIVIIVSMIVVLASVAAARNAISLDEVVGATGDQIPTGSTIEFRLRIQVDLEGLCVYGNAFRVHTPDGATWHLMEPDYLLAWPPFGERSIWISSSQGIYDDTVVFFGEDSAGGFLHVYDDVAWSIVIDIPDDPNLDGKTVCLGALWQPAAESCELWSSWQWCTLEDTYSPSWDGPHCFMINSCCLIRGDTNHNGAGPDIADLVYLVTYMFQFGPEPPCMEEADINGDGVGPDIADLVYLVTYMFQFGPAPVPCP